MDSAPQSHPILSYVLSCLPTLSMTRPSPSGDFDIEQPPMQTPSPLTPSSLVERMLGLHHPSMLRAMTRVVADVSRNLLQVWLFLGVFLMVTSLTMCTAYHHFQAQAQAHAAATNGFLGH